MSVERFVCVTFPLRHLALVTERRVKGALGVVVLVAVPTSFVYVFLPDRSVQWCRPHLGARAFVTRTRKTCASLGIWTPTQKQTRPPNAGQVLPLRGFSGNPEWWRGLIRATFPGLNQSLSVVSFRHQLSVGCAKKAFLLEAMLFAWHSHVLCFFARLQYGHTCSAFTILDPDLQAVIWLPLFAAITIISLCVYLRIGHVARQAQRQIRSQISTLSQSESSSAAGGGASAGGTALEKSQRRRTISLLLVIGIYVLTNVGE